MRIKKGIVGIVAIICIAIGAYLIMAALVNKEVAAGTAVIVIGSMLFIDVLIRDGDNKKEASK